MVLEGRDEREMKINDVVQFVAGHKWEGCFGYVDEDKGFDHPRRYMIGVPVPQQGVAYIFDSGENIVRIGEAVYVPK